MKNLFYKIRNSKWQTFGLIFGLFELFYCIVYFLGSYLKVPIIERFVYYLSWPVTGLCSFIADKIVDFVCNTYGGMMFIGVLSFFLTGFVYGSVLFVVIKKIRYKFTKLDTSNDSQ